MPRVTDRHGRPVSGQMSGLVEGKVTDNEDPSNMHRVKVEFPTLPDAPESYWARVVTPMAGEKRGWVTLPEVGDEVLVAFLHGDFNHAVVLGGLYNGEDVPPYTNDDGDNNLKVFQSRAGHKVTFDDTDGSERIEVITHNEAITIIYDGANQTISVACDGDIIIDAGGNFEVSCTDFTVSATGNVSVSATANLDFKGTAQATVDGGTMLVLTAAQTSIG